MACGNALALAALPLMALVAVTCTAARVPTAAPSGRGRLLARPISPGGSDPRVPGRRLAQDGLPQVTDGWYDLFHTYEEIVDRIQMLAEDERATAFTLPRETVEGQAIWGLRIAGKEGLRQRVVVTGMLHAREWLSASATMLLAEMLLKAMAEDLELGALLCTFEVVIVPVVNPDGLRYTFGPGGTHCSGSSLAACDRMWRKNRQPVAGSGCVGIDLNRAWPLDWGARGGESVAANACGEDYAGEHPLQPPEALGLCELLAELHGADAGQLCSAGSGQAAHGGWGAFGLPAEGVVAVLDVHSYGQLLLGGWAHLNVPMHNSVTVNALGEMMADAVNAECRSHACRWAYGIGDLGGEIYLTSGILTDWAQWALGAPSFTVELPPRTEYSGGFDPDPSTIVEYGGTLYTAARAMLGGLTQDWASVEADAAAARLRAERAGQEDACEHGGSRFLLQVLISLDLYPRETSWALVSPEGDNLAGWSAAAGGQREGDSASGGSIALCAGVYVLLLQDTAGDGICCDDASGDSSIYVDGQLLYKAPGDFGAAEVAAVALDASPVVRRIDAAGYPASEDTQNVMIALLNTLGNVTQLDTQHYLLPKGLSSPLERKTTPLGAAMAVGVVGAALAALLAGGCALSVWHRRRKRRELAAVLDVRRGAMNANPELLLAAPPPSGSFKQPAVMELQPSSHQGSFRANSRLSRDGRANTASGALPAGATLRQASSSSRQSFSARWSPERAPALHRTTSPPPSLATVEGASGVAQRSDSQQSTGGVALELSTPSETVAPSAVARKPPGGWSMRSKLAEAPQNASPTTRVAVGGEVGGGQEEALLSPPPGGSARARGSSSGRMGRRKEAESEVERSFEFAVLPKPAIQAVWVEEE